MKHFWATCLRDLNVARYGPKQRCLFHGPQVCAQLGIPLHEFEDFDLILTEWYRDDRRDRAGDIKLLTETDCDALLFALAEYGILEAPFFKAKAEAVVEFAAQHLPAVRLGSISADALRSSFFVALLGDARQLVSPRALLPAVALEESLHSLNAERVGFAISESHALWAMLVRPRYMQGQTLFEFVRRVEELRRHLAEVVSKVVESGGFPVNLLSLEDYRDTDGAADEAVAAALSVLTGAAKAADKPVR